MNAHTSSDLPPVERAKCLAAFVDVLIPGSPDWPSASQVGVHGLISLRLFAEPGERDSQRLFAAIGPGFANLDEEKKIEKVRALEAADLAFFEQLRAAIVLAYYETPFVVDAIQRLGRPYSIRPHVTGYAWKPFDMERDRPRHGRGHYVKTEDVRPVDPSGLQLNTVKTETWGLQR